MQGDGLLDGPPSRASLLGRDEMGVVARIGAGVLGTAATLVVQALRETVARVS
jgi:hypothetical protein